MSNDFEVFLFGAFLLRHSTYKQIVLGQAPSIMVSKEEQHNNLGHIYIVPSGKLT